MKFKRGDEVYIKRLKKFASVVEEFRPDQYRVLVGNLFVECPDSDLQKVDPKTHRKLKKYAFKTEFTKPVSAHEQRLAASVDLHGLLVDEAIRRAEQAIDRAILAGLDRLEIVHGLGTGKVRDAIHRLLPEIRVVQHFKLDSTNPGVTIVYF